MRSTPELIRDREANILAFLTNGEASTRAICIEIGFKWPLELEKVRSTLLKMEYDGLIKKSVRPNKETRIAYYSLTKSAPKFSAPHNSGERLPSNDAAEFGADVP